MPNSRDIKRRIASVKSTGQITKAMKLVASSKVTRAKNKLIIAADTEAVMLKSDTKDDLYNLIEYATNNGRTIVPPNESVQIEIGKSNGSVAEDEFFKSVS